LSGNIVSFPSYVWFLALVTASDLVREPSLCMKNGTTSEGSDSIILNPHMAFSSQRRCTRCSGDCTWKVHTFWHPCSFQ